MSGLEGQGNKISRRGVIAGLAATLLGGKAMLQEARAETAAQAISPEASKAFSSFREDLAKLATDIEMSVSSETKIDEASRGVDSVLNKIGGVLAHATDNGPLANICKTELAQILNKKKELESRSDFKPEDKRFLISAWTKREEQVHLLRSLVADTARLLSETMRKFQNQHAYLQEFAKLKKPVIGSDTALELKNAADQTITNITAFMERFRISGF